MITTIEETSKFEQKIASKTLDDLKNTLRKFDQSKKKIISLKVLDTNETLSIPKRALILLSKIVEEMSNGKSLNVVSVEKELTTQEAADILKVSRPHLVKLLESGEISFKKVGTHRRVQLTDVLSYDKAMRKQRRAKLDELTKQAQDLKMGYSF